MLSDLGIWYLNQWTSIADTVGSQSYTKFQNRHAPWSSHQEEPHQRYIEIVEHKCLEKEIKNQRKKILHLASISAQASEANSWRKRTNSDKKIEIKGRIWSQEFRSLQENLSNREYLGISWNDRILKQNIQRTVRIQKQTKSYSESVQQTEQFGEKSYQYDSSCSRKKETM